MIPSGVRSLSAAQWLQGLSAKGAPSQTGAQSNTGSTELLRDSTSISARAFQLNQAAGTSLKTDTQAVQSSAVAAAHHYRHHHSSHTHTSIPSVVNNAAQFDRSNSQGATSSDALASSDGSAAASSDTHGASFIQEFARKAANDIRTAYSPITAPEATPSPNRGSRSINVTA